MGQKLFFNGSKGTTLYRRCKVMVTDELR